MCTNINSQVIHKVYPYPQQSIGVSTEFDDILKNLVGAEVDGCHLLGIYSDCNNPDVDLEILCQKYIGTLPGCLSRHMGRKDNRDEPFLRAIGIMKRISPSEFLLQRYASLIHTADDSGVENGFVYESFLEELPDAAHAVFQDPPPRFVAKLCSDQRFVERVVTMHFSDPRIAEIYRTIPDTKNLFEPVSYGETVHALIFADYSVPDDVAKHLADLHCMTEKAKRLTIHLYMPNQLVDGKKHRKKMHQFLIDKYTISKICTIEATAFETSRRRRCIITLEEQLIPQSPTIPIQYIRRAGENGGYEMYSEAAADALIDLFCKGNKSISGLAENAYKRIDEKKNHEISDDFSDDDLDSQDIIFSPEIRGRGQVVKDTATGKFRLKMNMYGKPNARQTLENIDGRGSALLKDRDRVKGPRRATVAEARACAYEMLDHPKIRQVVCDDLKSRINDEDFSLFSFWYYYRDQIEKNGKKERKAGRAFFYAPKDPWDRCATTLHIRSCKESDIREIVGKKDKRIQLGELRKNLTILNQVFTIAVRVGAREDNPCKPILDEMNEQLNEMRKFRDAMGLRSKTMEQNRHLISRLLSEKGSAKHGLAIGAMICVLTGIVPRDVYSLTWESLSKIESVDVYQFVLNWNNHDSETELKKGEAARRCVPLCDLLKEAVLDWKACQVALPGVADDKKQPIVTCTKSGLQIPATCRDLTTYLRELRTSVKFDTKSIPIPVEDGSMKDHDLNQYGGSWTRANFDYCARIEAQIPVDDLNYILGRKLQSTDARHYRDYQKDLRQLALKTIIDRWAEKIRPDTKEIDGAIHHLNVSKKENIVLDGAAPPSCRYISITTPKGEPGKTIKFHVSARHGLTSAITSNEEVA